MFNPASIRIVRQGIDTNTIEGFVGVRRAVDGKMEFCLPFGFKEFDVANGDAVTRLFFSLYKTFKHFQVALEGKSDEPKKPSRRTRPDRDGSIPAPKGFSFVTKDDIPVTLHSTISNLEAVLTNYDELRIFSVITKPKRTSRVDYAQVGKYLHNAVFLEDDTAYVDEMVIAQPFVQHTITDLVQMYCYVLFEIKKAMEDEEGIPLEIRDQAQTFLELNLHPDSALFSPNHDFTIDLLRLALDNIHRQVLVRDADYWHFYTALERFLYGGFTPNAAGDYWGINTFSPIWEDMCLVYVYYEDSWNEVLYADSFRFGNTKIGRFKVFLAPNFQSPFYFKLGTQKRNLRPDLVRQTTKGLDSNADMWFERLFKVEWVNRSSCRITLKRVNGADLTWFNGLSRRLALPGLRRKKANATTHTFSPVREDHVQRAINGTKEEYEQMVIKPNRKTLISDFKYVDVASYTAPSLSEKIKYDIVKQLTYEYAIILNDDQLALPLVSQFCVPYYFTASQSIVDKVEDRILHQELRDQRIEVVKVNFQQIQKAYLSHT